MMMGSLMDTFSENMMTDADKIQALTDLMSDVIHALDMKQYDIEDPSKSYECEFQANQFWQKMTDILHSQNESDN